jgi:hypothetical protein
LKKEKIEIFASISAASKQGTEKLTQQLLPIVLEERKKRAALQEEEEASATVLPVIKPHLESSRMGAYRIEKTDAGVLVVRGKRLEQFTVMTNFENGGAANRFRDVAERTGLLRAIKRARKDQPDMPVYIGKVRVDEFL